MQPSKTLPAAQSDLDRTGKDLWPSSKCFPSELPETVNKSSESEKLASY